MERHHMKGGLGCPLTDQVIPLGAMVEYHPISAKDQSRLHQFGAKFLPDCISRLCIERGENLERRHDGRRHCEEMEEMDAYELHARRLNAKEVLTPQRNANFIFPVVDGTVKIFGSSQRLRTPTLTRDRPEQGEEQEILQGESDGLSSPTPHLDDSTLDSAEAKNDFWSITGDFIYRHHVEPRVKLYTSREESFPIPLKYIDVSRTTHTSLDVMLEKNLDDYWNVDVDRELSDVDRLHKIYNIE